MQFKVFDSDKLLLDPDKVYVYWDKKLTPTINSNIRFIDLKDLMISFDCWKLEDFSHNSVLELKEISYKIKNIIKSYHSVKIDIDQYKLCDLIPEKISSSWEFSKQKVLINILNFLMEKNLIQRTQDFFIKNKNLDIIRNLNYNINTTEGEKFINLLYAKNFRFKPAPGSFNLFGLKKELRNQIIPHNKTSFIYAIDFKQFEFRTFLKICNIKTDFEEPKLYESFGNQIGLHPETAKENIIAFLYGKNIPKIASVINKDQILSQIDKEIFWFNDIPVIVPDTQPEHVKIHTIVQTISQHFLIEKLNKVFSKMNEECKFIFPLHDMFIFSIENSQKYMVDEIENILQDDVYKVKKYTGPNLGELKENE